MSAHPSKSAGLDLDAIEAAQFKYREGAAHFVPALIAELRAARTREQRVRDFLAPYFGGGYDKLRMILDEVPFDGKRDAGRGRPFVELSASGILWLINRVVFHPRGFALALHKDTETGEVTGWSIRGHGDEVLVFTEPDDHKLFAAAERTLAECSAILDEGGPHDGNR